MTWECFRTARHLLAALQTLPRHAELLVFEAGCEAHSQREPEEFEGQGGRDLVADVG